MKQAILPVFVAHKGCPQQCSFCDQNYITGSDHPATPERVTQLCRTVAPKLRERYTQVELAFFGGSFTAIPREEMLSLLGAAKVFVDLGQIDGIRISTRPDCIDEEVLQLLKQHGVHTIELGAQSMRDDVLKKNLRGHDSGHVVRACRHIRESGFQLGLQMMVGLYGDDSGGALYTAERFVQLCADFVRVYPTVILEGTRLAELYAQGVYKPMSLYEAVLVCAQLLDFFEHKQIPVVKLGLHASELVEKKMVGGLYHPAFRDLCESKLLLWRLTDLIHASGVQPGRLAVYVAPDKLSPMIGQHSSNLRQLERLGFRCRVQADESLLGRQIVFRSDW